MTAQSKLCSKCFELKSVADFYKNPQGKGGYRDRCKSCWKTNFNDRGNVKHNPKNNPRRTEEQHASYRMKWPKGEVTLAELFAFQNGQCAVCGCTEGKTGKRRRHHKDHNHPTGYIRGYLCSWCNHRLPSDYVDYTLEEALAFFEAKKMKPSFYQNFMEYLKNPPLLQLLDSKFSEWHWEELYLPVWVPMNQREGALKKAKIRQKRVSKARGK